MKNQLIVLCAVTTVVTSVTGCGCCRRLRDFVCRGARCGGPTAAIAPAPAPVLSAPPIAAAPMIDPGCSYAGFDPGCAYGGQVVGFPPAYDSGWMPGGPACESCNGSYSYPVEGYPVDAGAPINSGSTPDPGPARGGSGTR